MPERRPLTADLRHWLLGETAHWQESGLLSADQVGRIFAQYEPEQATRQRSQNVFLFTLGGLAALLLGAAIMLLVGFNWNAIPAAGKLAIIFGGLIAVYAGGGVCWRMQQKRAAEIVFFFAAIMYGAAIWLIAQIFHMSAHYPDGYFWWAVGILPLVLILDTLPLHLLFAILLSTWFSTEITGYRFIGASFFGLRWHDIPNGVFLAPVLAAPGLWLAYRNNSLPRLAIYLVVLTSWICLQPFAWRWSGATPYFIGAVGTMLLILGESHLPESKFAIPYRVLGVMLFGGALLPLSSHWFSRGWLEAGPAMVLAMLIAVSTGFVFAAAEYMRFRQLESGRKRQADLTADVRNRQWLPLVLAGIITVLTFLSAMPLERALPVDGLGVVASVVLANVAMLTLALWLMWVGLRDDRGQPFVGGIIYFLLWMVLRYTDLFGLETGMLGAAALFAICGLLIGGLAWFWHQRKVVWHAS
jgi:uncharacterized membrane protein